MAACSEQTCSAASQHLNILYLSGQMLPNYGLLQQAHCTDRWKITPDSSSSGDSALVLFSPPLFYISACLESEQQRRMLCISCPQRSSEYITSHPIYWFIFQYHEHVSALFICTSVLNIEHLMIDDKLLNLYQLLSLDYLYNKHDDKIFNSILISWNSICNLSVNA